MSQKTDEYVKALFYRYPSLSDQLEEATQVAQAIEVSCQGLFDQPPTASNLAQFMTVLLKEALKIKKTIIRDEFKDQNDVDYCLAAATKVAEFNTAESIAAIEEIRQIAESKANMPPSNYTECVIFVKNICDGPMVPDLLSRCEPVSVWDLLLLQPAFFLRPKMV
jgi:hypothetical protein